MNSQLESLLQQAAGSMTPEDRAAFVRTGLRIAELHAMELAGQDVESELGMAQVTAMQLPGGAGVLLTSVLQGWVARGIGALVDKVLPPV